MTSLHHPYWYRVRDLRVRLRPHLRVHRHSYRGLPWHLIEDPASGRHHRLTPSAWSWVALLDGRRTVHEAWEACLAAHGDAAPSQGEAIALLAHLHQADLVQADVSPDAREVFERFSHGQRARARGWRNLVSVRVPLGDPHVRVAPAARALRPLFSRAGFAAWCVLVGLGVAGAASHLAELTAPSLRAILEPGRLVLLAATYVVVKTFHELGHALAAEAFGGEVHEVGVVFLLGLPVPYVDASSSSAFPDKARRMTVGAAGVMVELALASLALFVWLQVEPGVVRSLAWNVMAIGGVSTLLFNGNPLLRFDGYYVLADLLEMPNLATRSGRYLSHLFDRYVLGLPERRLRPEARRERTWLLVYGVSSFLYRTAVLLLIALFVAEHLFFVGVLLAGGVVAGQLVAPAVRGLGRLRRDPRVAERPARALGGATALAVALVLLVVAMPFPSWTRAEGVVWPPRRSLVRAGADGFVWRLAAAPGAPVAAGQPLLETRDPLADARVRVLEARVAEVEARLRSRQPFDRVDAEVLEEELRSARAELSRARERVAETVVRSPVAGRWVLVDGEDLIGRFVERGRILGHVLDGSAPVVRTVVTDEEVARVRQDTLRVEVRLASDPGRVVPAAIAAEVPAGDERLPSAVLGSAGGGRVAIDRRDAEGLTTARPVFEFDLRLGSAARVPGIGLRAHVRFRHAPETLAARGWRGLRRLLLGRFGV